MLTLHDHFEALLSAMEPQPERAEVAQKMPTRVRDFLEKSAILHTVEPHSRLAGSYARHTALKNIKDVDILVLIAPEYAEEEPEAVLESLFKALGELPEALDDEGEVVIRRHQRRSVNVHLERQAFDLDVVPALAPHGLAKPLLIPDRDWSKWVPTHPLGYASSLSSLNQDNGGKVVPLVKLLKHWRDEQMTYRRPKSYWLECIVHQAFSEGAIETKAKSYAELFAGLLEIIQDGFARFLAEAAAVPVIADPMLGNNVSFNWERSAFESFMRRLDESRGWVQSALAQEDPGEAAELWRKVFGEDWFPLEVLDEKVASLRAAALAGSYYVTPAGRVLTTKPIGPAVQPPPQRFYGAE